MLNRKSIASVLIFAGSALCFFLPFVSVSCGGMKVGTFTGQQLATGVHLTQAQPFGQTRTQNYNGDPVAGLAFLSAIAGVGLSLAGRRLAAGAAASGSAGAIALFMMKSRLGDQLRAQSMGLAQVSYEPGFALTMSLLIAGVGWNLYLLFRNRGHAPSTAPLGDGLQPESGFTPGQNETASAAARLEPDTDIDRPPAVMPQLEPQPASGAIKARYCTQCGSVVSPGKRFCAQCGKENVQKQAAPQGAKTASVPLPAAPAHEAGASATTATAAFTASSNLAPFTLREPERIPEPVQVPAPSFAEPAAESAIKEPFPTIEAKRSGRIGWSIAVTAIVLAISAVAFWTVEWRKGTNLASVFSLSRPAQSVPQPATPASSTKPSPSGTLNSADTQEAVQPPLSPQKHAEANEPTRPQSVRKQTPPVAQQTSNREAVPDGANLASPNDQEATAQPQYTARPIAPPALTNGTLHYSGPPVGFGQTVAFSKLPSGRLRFSFDHTSWQPLISRQPDGTQTLTLRSLKQGLQTQCDVVWEIVP